ncbi:hypothetical protein KCP69_24205 [Salmonella enterica subsp. enterica]|nr:hypothetical protein KCP69_24205 [Salmonella enterica subsp. enterica]
MSANVLLSSEISAIIRRNVRSPYNPGVGGDAGLVSNRNAAGAGRFN